MDEESVIMRVIVFRSVLIFLWAQAAFAVEGDPGGSRRREIDVLTIYIDAYRKQSGGAIPRSFTELFGKFPSETDAERAMEQWVKSTFSFVLVRGEMPAEPGGSYISGFLILVERKANKRFGNDTESGRYCIWQIHDSIVAQWMLESQVQQFPNWANLERMLNAEVGATYDRHVDKRSHSSVQLSSGADGGPEREAHTSQQSPDTVNSRRAEIAAWIGAVLIAAGCGSIWRIRRRISRSERLPRA